jgi:hypothetical protein
MITTGELKDLSRAPQEGKAYYRPLVCHGDINNAPIFFVGTNPATPIYPKDIDLNQYVELLLDYGKFIDYYKELRTRSGKSEYSRTRIGINSFLGCLSESVNSSIIETEVIPYPTDKLKTLWKEPTYIINKGKVIFFDLVIKFSPRLLILHGKETVDQAISLFISKGLINNIQVNLDKTIEEMEQQVPLVEFVYPNGKKCSVVACRHFMYYGLKGESFSDFRNKVLHMLANNL